MDRDNHYEAAVEAYLRHHRLGYVAVDERRAEFGNGPVKSLDFVAYGPSGARLLIDVKGRRYPGGSASKPRHVWESWSTLDDIDGLERWTERFGPSYRGLLLFAYDLAATVSLPETTTDLWAFRDKRYLLRAVPVIEYRKHMRLRSPRWGTVGLPRQAYKELAQPLSHFIGLSPWAIPGAGTRTEQSV